MNNNQKLIDAVNCKFPQNNLIELYYNIGRALPFTAQRFPDGRVSDWYRNQYVQVVKVEPHGKFGKYGKVYGYYFRNGERADSSDSQENSWCKKEDTEPKEIPCCGCGSWFLLDIQGEPIEGNEVKVLGLDDIFTFGKYKDRTIKEVIDTDWNYVKWAIIDSQRLIADIDAIVEYHKGRTKNLKPDDIISFGKYKGKTLHSVFLTDFQYLKWMESQNPDFKIDWDKLSDFSQE